MFLVNLVGDGAVHVREVSVVLGEDQEQDVDEQQPTYRQGFATMTNLFGPKWLHATCLIHDIRTRLLRRTTQSAAHQRPAQWCSEQRHMLRVSQVMFSPSSDLL